MTSHHSDPQHHELSDSELDDVLSAADGELLAYIRANADPEQVLLAIMAASAADIPLAIGPADIRDDGHAIAVIEIRSIAHALTRAIDRTRADASTMINALNHALMRAFGGTRADAIADAIERARELGDDIDLAMADVSALLRSAGGITGAIACVLDGFHADPGSHTPTALRYALAVHFARAFPDPDLAIGLATTLAHAVDRAHAFKRGLPLARADIASLADVLFAIRARHTRWQGPRLFPPRNRGIDSALGDVRIRAGRIEGALAAIGDIKPIYQLALIEVDASGADLSRADFRDLDVLEGVIWTAETIWPPGVAGPIRDRSAEIRPGVFQVRGGSERNPSGLVTV